MVELVRFGVASHANLVHTRVRNRAFVWDVFQCVEIRFLNVGLLIFWYAPDMKKTCGSIKI